MTIYELWETILSSTADDWVHHEMVASMAPHTDVAAYRHDLSIGISWVMRGPRLLSQLICTPFFGPGL